MLVLLENLLLGAVPETLGMFFFGAVLVTVAVGLRWFLGCEEEKGIIEKPFKRLVESVDHGADFAGGYLGAEEK